MDSQHLLRQYKTVRAQTEHLCAPLSIEDYIPQPIVDVSPPKWHLAHTTWFFENFILVPHSEKYHLFRKQFNYLFNSYYESQGERIQRDLRGSMSRPTVAEVQEYRAYVDRHMEALLQSDTLPENVLKFIGLGLEHEQQHQELLITDLKYTMGQNPIFPAYRLEAEFPQQKAEDTIKSEYMPVEAGVYTVGHQSEDFCFDNELGAHQVFLHDFQILDRLVTNREYMEFISAGGYKTVSLWLMEGWEWVKSNGIEAPLYWQRHYDEWKQFTLYGLQEIDPEAPVTHISYYEAEAFARWKGKRLPTEFEWEVACRKLNSNIPKDANFLDDDTLMPLGRKRGNNQMFGDAWEWTNSAYLPYPYYKQAAGALGEYNGKFMVNQMVLRGGSCATPKSHIRATYRNFFHPDKRWQFTGIRLAETC